VSFGIKIPAEFRQNIAISYLNFPLWRSRLISAKLLVGYNPVYRLFDSMTAKRPNPPKRSGSKARAIAPPLATSEILQQMYSRMLRSRVLTDALLGSATPASSEGVTVGIASELKPSDTLCANRRQLVQYIASIAEGTDQFATWLSLALGRTDAALPFRIPTDGPGIIFPDFDGRAQIAMAIGAAHSFRVHSQPNVSVVLAGDLASGLLSAYEAARLAGESKLPVVFAFETRIDPRDADHHLNPLLRGEDFGFPRIPVDGNDSVAVHRVATEAIQRARQGDGPTLIECQIATTCHIVNSLGLAEDPIAHMRHYLRKHQLWSEEWSVKLESELHQLRDQLLDKQRK
jgi:TPP-dependent pyruvate/acetoin dehydrogenase alpha subunit